MIQGNIQRFENFGGKKRTTQTRGKERNVGTTKLLEGGKLNNPDHPRNLRPSEPCDIDEQNEGEYWREAKHGGNASTYQPHERTRTKDLWVSTRLKLLKNKYKTTLHTK